MIKLIYLYPILVIFGKAYSQLTQIPEVYLHGPCGENDECFQNGTCQKSQFTQRQYCKCNATQKNSFICSMPYESTVSEQIYVTTILAGTTSMIKANIIQELSSNPSITWDQIDQIYKLIKSKASVTLQLSDIEIYFKCVDYLIVRISGESDMTDIDVYMKQDQIFSLITFLAYRAIQIQIQTSNTIQPTYYVPDTNLQYYSVMIAPWQYFQQTQLPTISFNNSNIQFPVCKYNGKSIQIKYEVHIIASQLMYSGYVDSIYSDSYGTYCQFLDFYGSQVTKLSSIYPYEISFIFDEAQQINQTQFNCFYIDQSTNQFDDLDECILTDKHEYNATCRCNFQGIHFINTQELLNQFGEIIINFFIWLLVILII